MRRSRLKPVEKRLIASEWERNATRSHICQILNISPNTLNKQRQRMKLPARIHKMEENTHYVGFYTTPEMDRAIAIMARAEGLTKSAWLRNLVQSQLKV